MSDSCAYCMTPVLIQTLEMANKELAKLRAEIVRLKLSNKLDSDKRYELEAQIVEMIQSKQEPT